MKFSLTFVTLVSMAISSSNAFGTDPTKCEQDYNQKSNLQCGPGHPPCVKLVNDGQFINEPNQPLNCDNAQKICQYPEYSKMKVKCNQGEVDIKWAGTDNSYTTNADNTFINYVSNQCGHLSSKTSKQNGDTLLVSCNPLNPNGGNGGNCQPDYNYNRNQTAKAPFECGPGKSSCVTIEGDEGELIESPNKADHCDPFGRFCAFPKYSKFTVKCNQGTVTAQFAGKQGTFQNHAQNSIAYWMGHKCDGPSKTTSEQDGDLLVVKCNPLKPHN